MFRLLRVVYLSLSLCLVGMAFAYGRSRLIPEKYDVETKSNPMLVYTKDDGIDWYDSQSKKVGVCLNVNTPSPFHGNGRFWDLSNGSKWSGHILANFDDLSTNGEFEFRVSKKTNPTDCENDPVPLSTPHIIIVRHRVPIVPAK